MEAFRGVNRDVGSMQGRAEEARDRCVQEELERLGIVIGDCDEKASERRPDRLQDGPFESDGLVIG